MNSKERKISEFYPSGVGKINENLFGLPFTNEESDVIVIPVPWDVTVSFEEGTSNAPKSILKASPQLDLYDSELENAWQYGISMLPIPHEWDKKNESLREKAKSFISDLENGISPSKSVLNEINEESESLRNWVKNKAIEQINNGKKVCLLGGDHSTPLGLYDALSTKFDNFGILQIDAHCDLRNSYEGFKHSHASIMYNALKNDSVSQLTQVGIRDYCEEEVDIIESDKRINTFFDKNIQESKFSGESWDSICDSIVETLPKHVHISFDVDGLKQNYCPNTGTPVPGGLEYEEVFYLFKKIINSKRKIISFDLVEVGDSDWDANVGARILYRLSNIMIKSQL